MMKKVYRLYYVAFFFLVAQHFVFTQNSNTSNIKSNELFFPQEKVFIHYNSSLLLVGEYLYYSVYCSNDLKNEVSSISKIGYVELLAKDGTSVFKHKIRLKQGRGQGDFFIPTNISSGSYKLLGYTDYMRNWKEDYFFKGDLIVINPYNNNQENLLENPNSKIKSEVVNSKDFIERPVSKTISNGLNISLNKKTFYKREKVELNLKIKDEAFIGGDMSISIRKKTPFQIPQKPTITSFTEKNKKLTTKKREEIKFLPELRGELIQGKVSYKDSKLPAQKIKLFAIIPGKNNFIRIITTNNDGSFFLNLEEEYEGQNIIFRKLGSKEILVELNEKPSVTIDKETFFNFNIDASMKRSILNLSIQNQIENNYFSFKPDSTKVIKKLIPFYGNISANYLLDDYNRFNTFEETVIEVLKNVSIRKYDNGQRRVLINSNLPNNVQSGFLPLILINGLPIENHNKLFEFNAKKIEKINVIQDKYNLNNQIFQGILDIRTFENEHEQFINKLEDNIVELKKPQQEKYYFSQQYSDSSSSLRKNKIPDFRQQLLWKPSVHTQLETTTIEFYTSDVPGEYEISIQGITLTGEPINLTDTFTVNDLYKP